MVGVAWSRRVITDDFHRRRLTDLKTPGASLWMLRRLAEAMFARDRRRDATMLEKPAAWRRIVRM
jgi:hypothetical protein